MRHWHIRRHLDDHFVCGNKEIAENAVQNYYLFANIAGKLIREFPIYVRRSKLECLNIFQLFICIGVILWSYMPTTPVWSMYVQFIFFIFGSISSRIWCAINAVALLFMQYRSLCFVLKLMPLFVSTEYALCLCSFIANVITESRLFPSPCYCYSAVFYYRLLLLGCTSTVQP